MKWTQIKTHCRTEELPTVCAVMSMIDQGLMIEDYSDIEENLMTVYGELIDEKILQSDRNAACVSVYVPEERELSGCLSFLEERFAACGLSCFIETVGLDEEDWANNWKEFYKPQHIGKHILVLPPWEKCEIRDDDVVIVMDPGMAFGTGTHETTRLCLQMLEKHLQKGAKVLDVGTGSGILAIAAAKLGADCVKAYDIDAVAVRVAKENIDANGAADKVSCGQSDLLRGVDKSAAPYDFVCANIVADILVRLAPDVGAYMAPGAKLAAAGIIEGRRNDVAEAMTAGGLTLVDEARENDWVVLVFEKKGA